MPTRHSRVVNTAAMVGEQHLLQARPRRGASIERHKPHIATPNSDPWRSHVDVARFPAAGFGALLRLVEAPFRILRVTMVVMVSGPILGRRALPIWP